MSSRATVLNAADTTLAEQCAGVHSSLTFGSDANVRNLVSSTLVPLVYQGGAVSCGAVRFLPGDFLSANSIANLYGGASISTIAGDDSASLLLANVGDQYSITGVSVEFIPEVVFLDRGGSLVVNRFSREVTYNAGPVADLLPGLDSASSWPLEASAAAGVYPQELENTNRFEFGEFTLVINPLDPENGHMFTRRDPDGTSYTNANEAAVAFIDSPEFLSKVSAWGLIQIEYIAPAGMPVDQAVIGHFRIRRSFQEIYVPSPDTGIAFTLAAGIAPSIVLPDDVKEAVYAREAVLASANMPVRGPNSFDRAIGAIGKAFKGAFDTASGIVVGVQSALAGGVRYIRDNPEVAEAAVNAAAMLLSRGRSGKMPGVPKALPMLKM